MHSMFIYHIQRNQSLTASANHPSRYSRMRCTCTWRPNAHCPRSCPGSPIRTRCVTKSRGDARVVRKGEAEFMGRKIPPRHTLRESMQSSPATQQPAIQLPSSPAAEGHESSLVRAVRLYLFQTSGRIVVVRQRPGITALQRR